MVIYMKKKILIGLSIILVIGAIACLIYASSKLHDKQVEEDNHLIEITMDELQTKIDNKENFILLVSQTECSHCLEFKPKLKRVLAKNNVIAYNIETDKLTKEEYIKLNNIAYTSGTPTTLFFENGTETNTSNRLNGSGADEAKITSRLKAMGYIKE